MVYEGADSDPRFLTKVLFGATFLNKVGRNFVTLVTLLLLYSDLNNLERTVNILTGGSAYIYRLEYFITN